MDLDGNQLASLSTVSLTRTLALEGDKKRGHDRTIPVKKKTPTSDDIKPMPTYDGSAPVGNAFPFSKKPPMDPSERVIVGSWFHELKARVLAFESRDPKGRINKGSWLREVVTSPEGFVVEMEGVVAVAAHGEELGKRLDCLVLQCRALAKALSSLPGRYDCLWIFFW